MILIELCLKPWLFLVVLLRKDLRRQREAVIRMKDNTHDVGRSLGTG